MSAGSFAFILLKLMDSFLMHPYVYIVLIGIPAAFITQLVRTLRQRHRDVKAREAREAAHQEALYAQAVERRKIAEAHLSSQAAVRDRARRIAEAREAKERAIEQAKTMIAIGDMDGYEYLKEAQAMKIPE